MAHSGDLELALPECPKGLGKVIGAVDSADLIAGVRAAPLKVWAERPDCFSWWYSACGSSADSGRNSPIRCIARRNQANNPAAALIDRK